MDDTKIVDRFTREQCYPHYYGDLVRACFVAICFILLIAVLIDRELLGFYLSIGAVGILGLIILAGLTSPKKSWVIMIEACVAGVGFLAFEFFAVQAYVRSDSSLNLVFVLRQTLSVIFLIALYYSVKSIRGSREDRDE